MKTAQTIAAALALVGWYLMTPPVTLDQQADKLLPHTGAPFSEWDIYSAFDSASDCEAAKSSLRGNLAELKKQGWSEIVINAATCVATDDPRLKKGPWWWW